MMEAQGLAGSQNAIWSHAHFHVEVLHLLQGEENRDATLLNYVDNREHRSLRREPHIHGLMNRRRL